MTTDLRDPSRYLSGGELVLSGLAWRRDAAEQLEAQRIGVQQCAQPHSRRRRSLSRSVPGHAAVSPVAGGKQGGFRWPPFIRIYKMPALASQLLQCFCD
jgi:hypothetical protein